MSKYYGQYSLCDTEFLPHMLHKRIEGHPNGGMSICLVWSLHQAEQVFHHNGGNILTLCVNQATMKLAYCDSITSAVEFYNE